MRNIEMTVEKTMRVSKEMEVTDEDLEMLFCGINKLMDDEMEKELENGDVEYDYTVTDVETEETLVDWS